MINDALYAVYINDEIDRSFLTLRECELYILENHKHYDSIFKVIKYKAEVSFALMIKQSIKWIPKTLPPDITLDIV